LTHPFSAADFFSLEAGECLDRLEALLNREEPPAGEDMLRAARALRGSALMAGQQPLARAAASLEAVTRAVREGTRDWDFAVREQVAEAIEEFRLLVRRIREWGEADTARAARLGAALESLAGGGSAEVGGRRGGRTELDAGVRAFIARENALIASALDRAARSLQIAPGDREPLYTVIRRMQSLRGLAELGELVPLPEILDGIELAVGDLTRLFAPPPGVEEVMSSAATALARIARDVTEQGRPDPEAEEARRFTDLLLRAFAVERDVVPIESLYFVGDTQALTPPASQPQFASPAPLGPLELVSHGEHLCQIADLIGRSRSATERDLRLYHLLAALRTAGTPGSDPVAGALAVFARSTREALAAGVAAHATAAVVDCLRAAGELLRSVADADDRMQVSRRVLDVAHRLDELRAVPEVAGADTEAELAIVPIQSLAYDLEPDVVPIESLAPDTAAAAADSGLESSFTTFERLERERGPAAASLEALLRRPRPVPAGRSPVDEVVSIEALCYRGRGALERALALRHELTAELAGLNDPASIHPLLQELLDLVPLALADS